MPSVTRGVPIRNRPVRWALVFLFWTLIGLSFASQFYLASYKAGRPVTWGQAVGWSLGDWYVWALMSVPIVQLARRFRFDDVKWGRNVAIHLAASAICSLGYMALRAGVGQAQSRWGGTPVSFAETFNPLLVKTFHLNLLIYWVIVSVHHAFGYYRQMQERELRAAELEKRLAQARLQTLQMQLNPHFLFNSLHAISALVHKDADMADQMITRLSDLLRYALESTDAQEVPLRQELDFLRRYLEIEQTRFGDRLAVLLEIAPETLDALVPNLLLQPLVENAIRHGIEPRAKPGRIEVRSRCENGRLKLEVRDNGVGLLPGRKIEEGVGLSNTRARLKQLYGDRHRFALSEGPDGGLAVCLELPFHAQGDETKSAARARQGSFK
jgi:two-component system LytT family sensor kinase